MVKRSLAWLAPMMAEKLAWNSSWPCQAERLRLSLPNSRKVLPGDVAETGGVALEDGAVGAVLGEGVELQEESVFAAGVIETDIAGGESDAGFGVGRTAGACLR